MNVAAPIRVLLVEDDADDYEHTREMLAAIPGRVFELDWIVSYDAAGEAVRRNAYDVCLLDYYLGKEHGLTFLEEAVSAGVTTPFVLLTGRGDRSIEQAALAAGASDYLAKADVASATLERAIRHAMERGRMIAALRASERRFRAMIEKGGDGITLHGADLRSFYQSPAVEAITGYGEPEAHGMSWREFVDKDQYPRVEAAIEKLRAKPGATAELELELRRPDGSHRTIALRACNLLADPDVGAIVSNFQDITGRKIAERQRDGFFELTLDLFCVAGPDGRFRKLNPAWEQTLGWSREELSARPFNEFIHPDDVAATESMVAQLTTGKRTVDFHNRYRTRDGGYRCFRWTAIGTVDDGLIYAAARDVTDERAAAERDRLLFALSPIAKWLLDAASSRVLDVNNAALALLGYSREQLLGIDARDLVVDPARGEQDATVRCLRANDGTIRELEVTGQPLELQTGPALLEVLSDVTARNRALAELRDSEQRYRRIVENTSEGVWIYDANGLTTFMNLRMAKMLGTTVEEAVGMPVFHFMDDTQIPEARDRIDRRARGISERREFRLKRRDGSSLWISSHADPLFDSQGRFESSVELVTDITELRQAALVRRRLAAIVESSRDAIISCDRAGAIRSWNPAAERLTQYSAEEAIGQPVSMLMDASVKLGGDASLEYEGPLRRRDGSYVQVSLSSSSLDQAEGGLEGTSLILRDISERLKAEAALRRTEDQLRQAQKMEAIGSLAGGVAHDFNNLLTVILSYTDMIIEDLPAGDPLRTDVIEVRNAGNRAAELTRQLLAFSRKQILEPRVLDVNEVLRGIETMLARIVGEDIDLSLILSAKPALVNADVGQLEQVVMNLVVNARDALPDGGNLTIETSLAAFDEHAAAAHVGVTPGAYVLLVVSDSGLGMDRETQARIFEPFFTTKEKSKGTGLGLSTVYGIVQQSGGHIWVYSEIGSGTTFKIYLPLTRRELQSTLIPIAELRPMVRGSETILLVEDEPQVRQLIRTLLAKHGYHVLDAANAGEALLVCEQFSARIHLMLTDVVMPRMSGRALAERLATERPEMKVLFMSGYTENTITHHGVLDAGVEFLAKPITPESLLRKVRSVLDQRRASA